MENGMQMTLEECTPEIFQKPTAGASDFHAKISQSQESKPDFKETVQACFSELCTLPDSSKKEDKPTYLFIENVKNLLSVNGGWDFARLLIEMEQCGYDSEWQVLNSKDFGVPQNRERCFIIGHLRGRSTSKVFPIEGTDGKNSVSLNLFGLIDVKNSQKDRIYSQDGLAPTVSTCGGGNTEPKIAIPVLTPDRAEKRQNGRRFKEDGEPMFTLTSQDRHGVAIDPLGVLRNAHTEYGKEVVNTLDISCNKGIFVKVSDELIVYAVWYEKYQRYIAIRKLTPKECFRLQGWPDDYFEKAQFVNSDSQLYKQAGNGVTVTVIEAIARKMNVNLN